MFRHVLATLCAVGLLVFPGASASRPNFVLILADDLGWRDVATYGNPHVATPNLDRLAREGARFTNAYAASPVCSPTRASILTGRYPARTGVTDWIAGRPSHEKGPITTPRTLTELGLQETTIAERLKPAGYRSASIGKWHLGGQGFWPTDQGFDENIGGNHAGSPPPGPRPYFGPFELPNLAAAEGEFLTEKLTQAAEGFITRNASRAFLLYLAHYTVHIPLSARDADVARHAGNARGRYNPVYAAMVESLDESVGRVLRAIDAAGVADRTMVVFFSDNGGLRYEGHAREAVTNNSPLRAGKGHLYEGGIREPLIVRFPGVVRPGTVIDTPVSSVDLLPTLADAAGVDGGGVDGVSLMPLLRGRALPVRALFWHYPHYSNQGGEPGSAIREGDWKLIEFNEDGRRELYNLRDDPSETRNLVVKEPKVAARLAGRLGEWRKTTGAVMPQRNPKADPAWPGWGLIGREEPTPPVR